MVVVGRIEGLVVDAHAGATGAERHTLEHDGNHPFRLLVDGINNENFTVAGILLCHNAVSGFCRRYRLCPRARSVALTDVGENVEIATAPHTTGEDDIAVGKFLHLRFVAFRSRRSVDAAQGVPRTAEVVAVHHAVATGAGAKGSIKAIVATEAHLAALTDATAAEEERLHRAQFALVEKRIDAFGDVLGIRPRAAVVGAAEDGHSVGIFACGGGCAIDGVARHAHHNHLTAAGVGHYGSVAIAAGQAALDAVALRQHEFGAPRSAVVVGDAIAQVHTAVADVGAARPIVGQGEEVARLRGRDGRDAIGRLLRIGLEKGLFQGDVAQRAAQVETVHRGGRLCTCREGERCDQQKGGDFHGRKER